MAQTKRLPPTKLPVLQSSDSNHSLLNHSRMEKLTSKNKKTVNGQQQQSERKPPAMKEQFTNKLSTSDDSEKTRLMNTTFTKLPNTGKRAILAQLSSAATMSSSMPATRGGRDTDTGGVGGVTVRNGGGGKLVARSHSVDGARSPTRPKLPEMADDYGSVDQTRSASRTPAKCTGGSCGIRSRPWSDKLPRISQQSANGSVHSADTSSPHGQAWTQAHFDLHKYKQALNN